MRIILKIMMLTHQMRKDFRVKSNWNWLWPMVTPAARMNLKRRRQMDADVAERKEDTDAKKPIVNSTPSSMSSALPHATIAIRPMVSNALFSTNKKYFDMVYWRCFSSGRRGNNEHRHIETEAPLIKMTETGSSDCLLEIFLFIESVAHTMFSCCISKVAPIRI